MSFQGISPGRGTVCGHPGPREELLADAGFDTDELRALDVMRLVFAGMSGHVPRHTAGLDQVAGALFGQDRGGLLLAGLTAFVHTMAISRSENFRYSNPFCRGCALVLTQNEGHLLRVLHHARRGRRGRAMTHALLLCDSRPVEALLDAAEDLAGLMPFSVVPGE